MAKSKKGVKLTTYNTKKAVNKGLIKTSKWVDSGESGKPKRGKKF